MEIYTIGFTKKTASQFFELVKLSGALSLTDVRRHPDTQLSGFAKGRDLAYFLPRLTNIPYRAELLLAPSEAILNAYRGKEISWAQYEEKYLLELKSRQVELALRREDFDGTLLLCSESTADKCHRRLAVEYLSAHWGEVKRVDL